MPETRDSNWTLSGCLIRRLQEVGIRHLFGVPGDYILDFLDQVAASPVRWVGTCNELNAGYAADGYARLNGAGAVVVTYCVGGFSVLNAVAGAYAERVPLIVISGAPPGRRRAAGALVHHLVSDYDLQLDIFRKVTVDAAILNDPAEAPAVIDRVIGQALLHKLPVYLELPADLALAPCRPPSPPAPAARLPADDGNLEGSLEETADRLNRAKRPIALLGVETQRFGLGRSLLELVEHLELPFATMLSSKSVLPELHPQFIGIYQGGWSRPAVSRQVEESDCLLSLGAWMTDLDTGMFSEKLDRRRMIIAGGGRVRLGGREYTDVPLGDFIHGLASRVRPRSYVSSHPVGASRAKPSFVADPSRELSAPRLYERLDLFLDDRMVLLAEPGDAFCAAPEFHIEEADNFIVQAYYASIGYCTPAALGVGLARPGQRPVVLTGDGAFQMTAQELGTLVKQNCPAVILLLNNDGYLIERMLHQDGPYNDIRMWNYADLPAALGGGDRAVGLCVRTEGELEEALAAVAAAPDKLFLLDLRLPGRDCSAGLKRLGDAFRNRG